jgi:hypothetical protein
MPRSASRRLRSLVACLALSLPLSSAAQDAGTIPDPGFTFDPPPCQGNVFLDVNCSGQFDAWIEQYARDSITGGCGGGNYCPDNPVTRGQMAVFVEKAMRGSATWPPNTVLVHAILAPDGSVDPVPSGTALRTAVTAIPATGPGAPSLASPWLVRVGPGTFDIGLPGLVLPDFVTLEGSGPELTAITASGSKSTVGTVVTSAIRGTIRRIAIRNSGGADQAVAISNPGLATLILEDVWAIASGSANPVAVHVEDGGVLDADHCLLSVEGTGGGNPVALVSVANTVADVEDTDIRILGSGGGGGAIGAVGAALYGTSRLDDVRIQIDVAFGTPNFGVRLQGGSHEILGADIDVRCQSSAEAIGIYMAAVPTLTTIRQSDILALGSGCVTAGIQLWNSNLTILDSQVWAAGESGKAIETDSTTSQKSILVHRSTLRGIGASLDADAPYLVRIGASYLSGPATGTGDAVCVASYGSDFGPLDAACN